ncbi:DUF6542 domain-containing protein [Nocardiopsis halophila]|uniref:DUF6542 domain-containing protein n=1 Tax=Nocardiopsis halophila TaxID=141692 RepID=UPI000345E5BD|nr:DUF6542 domain-containing protein [Nocardiopsis halophila]
MATRNTETPEDPRAPFFVPPPPRRHGGKGAAAGTKGTPKRGRQVAATTTTKPGATGRGGKGTKPNPAAAPARPKKAQNKAQTKAQQSGGVRLTGRGGVLVIMAASLSAALAAEATGWTFLNGGAFVVACVAAALLVRPSDLLGLTVSPPLAYFTAAVAAECVLTLGSNGFVRGLALGMGTRLADIAPWLFLGTALVLIIAVFRGLPSNVRDFSDELNGRRPRT